MKSGCFMTSRKQQSRSLLSSRKRRRRNGSTRKEPRIREVALAKVKDDLSKYLRMAVREEIVITRHGRPAGVLIGFESEDDWFDYRIENHPDFLRRIAESRSALQRGLGIRLEDLDSGRPNKTYLDSSVKKRHVEVSSQKSPGSGSLRRRRR